MVLFAVNNILAGQAQYVNLITQTVLYRHHFRTHVSDVKFSMDGRFVPKLKSFMYFYIVKTELSSLFKNEIFKPLYS